MTVTNEVAGAKITRKTLESLEKTSDPRLKEVMTALVQHLHAFIREVALTEEEWMGAIQFLTRTGQMCDDKRQEFILLSDTLGVSMLVDAVNHPGGEGSTENTIFGPFYREGAEEMPAGGNISKDGKGEPAVVRGRVLSTEGTPIANAELDVWEGGENGLYEQQDPDQPDMNLRGKFHTDSEGRYEFVGIRPVSYPIPFDGPVGQMLQAMNRHYYRPGHIHLVVRAEGYVPVTTHIFVRGDEFLGADPVFGVKEELITDFVPNNSAEEAARYGIKTPFYTVDFDFMLKPAS
ncbi:MAG TPA: intradiol ring-cleavage dioxygenase [Chloroflexia bacterium]|nr:intradiol ring-cleavage dioxygenase [Chloroflexia bacterium]